MTNVSIRDKKTAELRGIKQSTARSVKNLLSRAREELDQGLMKGFDSSQAKTKEQVLENLQKFFFGAENVNILGHAQDLRMLKNWLENVAAEYYMHYAISLFEACYLSELNHTTRTSIVKELSARSRRFNIMLRVINECLMLRTNLRRFTTDEQNDFMHG